MFILTAPQNQSKPCKVLNHACTIKNSELLHCFLNRGNFNGLSLTVAYGPDWNFTLPNVTTRSLRNIISDYSREPFGGWDLRTSVRSARRLAILVYSEAYQLLGVKSIAISQSEYFLMGRLTFADFETLVGDRTVKPEDAPLLLVSDKRRAKCLIWRKLGPNKDIIANLQLVREGKFDAEMAMRLDAIQGRSKAVWYLVGLVVLAAAALGFVGVRRMQGGCEKQE
jgi:hypothetical protein